MKDYKPYADYDLPLLYFGDFHSSRKEEQNKFLLDVSEGEGGGGRDEVERSLFYVLYHLFFKVRERVLSRVRSGRGDLTLSDVVHSDIIPNIG